mmetsp:Transcript_11105/g.20078  ORF Transcript_11105/g.20078 Transcript_11105/m.20078 type:complete len:481 (-) Transcript_11105:1152-2594(-)
MTVKSEAEIRDILDRAFGNDLAAEWLLSRSEAPPVAIRPSTMQTALSAQYILFDPENKPVDMGLFQSGSNIGKSTIETLLVHHWTVGDLIFATIFDVSPNIFYDIGSHVDYSQVRRMVVDLAATKGLELFTFCWFGNGQSVLSNSVFGREGGFECTNFLFKDFSPRFVPCPSDILRTAVLIDTDGCQFCLLRGVSCTCPPDVYHRAHPPADSVLINWNHWTREFGKLRNRISESKIFVSDSAGNILANNKMFSRVRTLFNDDSKPELLGLKQRYLAALMPESARARICYMSSEAQGSSADGDTKNSTTKESLSERISSTSKTEVVSVKREMRQIELMEEKQVSVENSDRKQNVSRKRDNESCSNDEDLVGDAVKKSRVSFHYNANGEREYRCESCEKVFWKRFDLKRHSLMHSKEKPFKCTKCDSSFSQKAHLKTHTAMVHERSKVFVCSICKKEFGSNSNLRKHHRNLHGNSELSHERR